MPTYQYSCTQCGHDLEARQGFSDHPLTDCPSCQRAGVLRKQYGSVGVVFKGSGFYRNDSRSSSSTELSKNDSQGSSDAGKSETKSGSESGSESKTETKSESKSDSSSSSSDSKPAAKQKDTAAA